MSCNHFALFLFFSGLKFYLVWSQEVLTNPNTNKLPIPTTCKEAMRKDGQNGVYLLQAQYSNLPQFYAYRQRDAQNGAPWLIIQRRSNDKVIFYRYWQSYQNGFGNLNGDYWLGLDLLHAITYAQRHELWFHMQDFDNEERDAFYNLFIVGSEKTAYELKAVGNYTGNAGDSFSDNAGHKFLAKQICDARARTPCNHNCASRLGTGGWWFNDCSDSNFNGVYRLKEDSSDNGINWHAWHGKNSSLKSVHMAIRPVDDNAL